MEQKGPTAFTSYSSVSHPSGGAGLGVGLGLGHAVLLIAHPLPCHVGGCPFGGDVHLISHDLVSLKRAEAGARVEASDGYTSVHVLPDWISFCTKRQATTGSK